MKPRYIWIIFTVCLIVVLLSVAWANIMIVRLNDREISAQRQAAQEEKIRLALWRIDSALAPMIAQENVRPYFVYNSFYPVMRAYTRMFAEIEHGEILTPSPLLSEIPSRVILHFQVDPQGNLTSPQMPTDNMYDIAEMRYTTSKKLESARTTLNRLQKIIKRSELEKIIPRKNGNKYSVSSHRYSNPSINSLAQQIHNSREWKARNRSYRQMAQNKMNFNVNEVDGVAAKVHEGVLYPVWSNGALFLIRRVYIDEQVYFQGCWLDWPNIKQWLLHDIKDLLPQADLQIANKKSDASRMPATLPVLLIAGKMVSDAPAMHFSLKISLWASWICVVLAAIAVISLLMGVMSLSERRASFVSAVTHELRTPLTTFRMYTEMLTEGMIKNAEKKQRYLMTLRKEAERLGHLVENVLAYARLDGKRARKNVETTSVENLINKFQDRLQSHAAQSNMKLNIVTIPDKITTDVGVVDQILFNLIDNACKYGQNKDNSTINIIAEKNGKSLHLIVEDHGAGITLSQAKRLFRPFCKSDHEAADTAPGIGLGLALSRRLARHIAGDLHWDNKKKHGARFILTLPL